MSRMQTNTLTKSNTVNQLSRSERSDFERLEGIIEHGLQTFVEVGSALLDIRNSRLYREEFKNFETYCRTRWQFSQTHANRLIAGAEVSSRLQIQPRNESVVRPLLSLPPKLQSRVWNQAVKHASGSPEKVTGRIVLQAVRSVRPANTDRPSKAASVNRNDLIEHLQDWYREDGNRIKDPNALFVSVLGKIRRF